MASESYWGVQRFIDSEICLDCDEFPCRCAELIDQAEEWDADPESEAT
jgi:hypothetical protein